MEEYNWELRYWSAERHRNALRRVCFSWNQYLGKFAHRYIRMTDIAHGVVSPEDFPRAIRLNLDLCECSNYANYDSSNPNWSLEEAIESCAELLMELLDNHVSQARLEIFQGDALDNDQILRFPEAVEPRSIISYDCSAIIRRTVVLPSLKLLIVQGDTGFRSQTRMEQTSLTTLNLVMDSFDSLERLHFTTLKHLSISLKLQRTLVMQEALLKILGSWGSCLDTFYWTDLVNNETIPDGIWTACPNIRNLQTPYKWGPAPSLALNKLQFCEGVILEYIWGAYAEGFPRAPSTEK